MSQPDYHPRVSASLELIQATNLQPHHTRSRLSETLAASEHIHSPDLVLRPRMAATVTDLISSTIKTLEEAIRRHNDVKDDNGLREVFHEAGRGLLLVNQALQAAQRNSAKEPQSAIDPLRACNTKANISASIFKVVAQAPETSRFKGYEAAVRQKGNGQTVEVLVVGMMNDVYALAENFAIQDQVKGLREAIEKLSKMEPSLPKEGPGNIFNNYGREQFNAPDGIQHINKNGNQVVAADVIVLLVLWIEDIQFRASLRLQTISHSKKNRKAM
ncbi:hypothetical protein DL771_003107 [Monosporascus sp. 5C6A]|nr:hypothetical protein DL771_003107 [Monosporascus sp. 5C6A]